MARIADCFLPADEIKQKYLRRSATLVDVRNPSDFDSYRIPGSLNIPLHLLKTKTFLKRDSVVLVNEGRSTAEMERACVNLRGAGFRQVAILKDGLNGWRTVGGEIVGDTLALSALNRITPDELFTERVYGDWLLLDFTGGNSKDLYRWLPAKVEPVRGEPANKLPESIRAALARASKGAKGARIVVVAANDADYERLEPAIAKAGVKRVLYLAGGLDGYRDFINKQIAIWNQKDQPVRFPSCRG